MHLPQNQAGCVWQEKKLRRQMENPCILKRPTSCLIHDLLLLFVCLLQRLAERQIWADDAVTT